MSNNPKDTKVSPVEILEAFRRNNPSILKSNPAVPATSNTSPNSDVKTESKLGITMMEEAELAEKTK